jgi:hypothetical protein
MTQRTSGPAGIPSSWRTTDAFLPTYFRFTVACPRGPAFFSKITRSSRGRSLGLSSTAPFFFIAPLSASATLSTTMHSFSSMQMTLLSIEQPITMFLPASSMSAVASTTAGGLPGPAQIARLPEFIAAATTPGPPVTTSRRTIGCFMSSPADWMVGSAMHVSVFGGPPAETIAWLRRTTVRADTPFADGCGLKTTVLPAATIAIELQMMVDGGFVTGVIAPMTPNGAGSISIKP